MQKFSFFLQKQKCLLSINAVMQGWRSKLLFLKSQEYIQSLFILFSKIGRKKRKIKIVSKISRTQEDFV